MSADSALSAPASAFLRDALDGLARPGQKTLPCKHLYDARGVELFEAITALEAYYPTRTERGILRNNLPEIAAALGPRVRLIEPGSGSSSKTRELLEALDDPAEYVPVDIAPEFLATGVAALAAALPGLQVTPVQADFTRPLTLPAPPPGDPTGRTVVFFPGSTIGNFGPAEARSLVQRLATLANLDGGGALLVGLDRVKPLDVLLPAYDDPEGVTAAFNQNLLVRLNREAGSTVLDPAAFAHAARWNAPASAVEMHLVARRPIQTQLLGQTVSFEAGESVHTETSRKFDDEETKRLFEGFSVTSFEDDRRWFSLCLVEAKQGKRED